ncbi:MAG: response regulator [Desulfobacterales bacterium]|nr:response regulator [Desulfobacterales bacterium]
MAFSVLIVDDSIPMRAVVKKTFVAAGYGGAKFIEADDGKRALELLKENWVDMVLTDYNMPVMNGLELIKEMKKNELFDQIPVVIISTEGSREKRDAFFEQGASGYIKKPFAPEQLRDVLIELLGEMEYEEDDDTQGDEFDF